MATNWALIGYIVGAIGVTFLVIGIGILGATQLIKRRRNSQNTQNPSQMNSKVRHTLDNDAIDLGRMNQKVRHTLDNDAIGHGRMNQKVKNTLDNDAIDRGRMNQKVRGTLDSDAIDSRSRPQ